MLKNYFKTAYRNLTRNKNYTMINISGLAVGIAVCIMIFIIIQFQSGFDNFHTKRNHVYRVLTEYHHADTKDIFYGAAVPFALPEGLKTAFPQLEEVAPVFAHYNDQFLILNNSGQTTKKFKEDRGVFYTNPSFFRIFDFPLLAGSSQSLQDPNNVLLTKEIAEKYFGDWKAAIGKTIKLNNSDVLKITGILATVPANTDFQLKVVVSYGTGHTSDLMKSKDWDGTNGDFGCYILLPKNLSSSVFNKQLIAYSKTVKSTGNKDVQTIQPLGAIHYDTQVGNFSGKRISHNLINILWLIAAFILLIACVNFINLSTAQAVNRAKEVGVRKVLGSNKWQLRFQFLAETFLIVFTSIMFAIVITWFAVPYFNNILEISLKITWLNAMPVILFIGCISVVVTALAGFYPSVVLSRFNPISALKSKLTDKATKGISLRRGLVVFQFVIAQSLIIGTLIMVKQMIFFTTQFLGFDTNAVVNLRIPTDSIANTKIDYLRGQLKGINGIQNVSFNSNTPVEDNQDNWTTFTFDHAAKETDFFAIIKTADNEYVSTYKLPLLAGRNIEASDTTREFLVNEMLIKNLGITNIQTALNKEIKFNEHLKGPIVGVLKDFNTRSFHDGLAPLIITSFKRNYNEASLKLASKDIAAVMQSVEKIWGQAYPDFVFEYKFLDEKVESFYKQENQLAYLYKIFSGIAIFLSCLGLYGLASFMAVQRTKEVGIRKVLGATARGIIYLFSKEFILLISIAFVIATPIAWYFMYQWLQNYPFRIELSWWVFLVGGIASFVIALATVSFQAIKAALANPVKSLRTE